MCSKEGEGEHEGARERERERAWGAVGGGLVAEEFDLVRGGAGAARDEVFTEPLRSQHVRHVAEARAR